MLNILTVPYINPPESEPNCMTNCRKCNIRVCYINIYQVFWCNNVYQDSPIIAWRGDTCWLLIRPFQQCKLYKAGKAVCVCSGVVVTAYDIAESDYAVTPEGHIAILMTLSPVTSY